MPKKIIWVAVLTIFLWTVTDAVPGMGQEDEVRVIEKGDAKMSERAVTNICPVSEDAIDSATVIRVEYKGKLYDLCSPGCLKHFKKFPEKFSAKAQSGRY